MLTEPLYQGLEGLSVMGMARTVAAQQQETHGALDFGDRPALLTGRAKRTAGAP